MTDLPQLPLGRIAKYLTPTQVANLSATSRHLYDGLAHVRDKRIPARPLRPYRGPPTEFLKELVLAKTDGHLPPVKKLRYKSNGFMGTRGTFKIGDLTIDTEGHYYDDDKSIEHYTLQYYRQGDTRNLAVDANGKVWYSPSYSFRVNPNKLTDWQLTDLPGPKR